jgi:uncharacterized membrane protein
MRRGRRKIRKECVIIGLILLTVGIVLAYSHPESLPEQVTLDKWDPVTPSTLSAQNQTGWDFTALTQGGNFLKLNVTASDNVALMIGELTYNNVTGDQTWNNLIFNQVGMHFAQDVAINGTGASFLEIDNNGTTPVNISGDVIKIGTINHTVYPYSLLGTLVALAGFILLIYGIVTRPGPGRKHSKKKTVKTWRPSA